MKEYNQTITHKVLATVKTWPYTTRINLVNLTKYLHFDFFFPLQINTRNKDNHNP